MQYSGGEQMVILPTRSLWRAGRKTSMRLILRKKRFFVFMCEIINTFVGV